MTETEWVACIDPEVMLTHLRGRAGERKWRLFAVGCCRRVWHLLDRPSRKAVDAAERYADGRLTLERLRRAYRRASTVIEARPSRGRWRSRGARIASLARAALAAAGGSEGMALAAAHWAAQGLAALAAERRGTDSIHLTGTREGNLLLWQRRSALGKEAKGLERRWLSKVADELHDAWWWERQAQAGLVRCAFGNPFRPVRIAPGVFRREGGCVRALALAAYDERAFDRLPILADALEEAGCDNPDILSHCRWPGEHVRGCWVLDLLIGKQ